MTILYKQNHASTVITEDTIPLTTNIRSKWESQQAKGIKSASMCY